MFCIYDHFCKGNEGGAILKPVFHGQIKREKDWEKRTRKSFLLLKVFFFFFAKHYYDTLEALHFKSVFGSSKASYNNIPNLPYVTYLKMRDNVFRPWAKFMVDKKWREFILISREKEKSRFWKMLKKRVSFLLPGPDTIYFHSFKESCRNRGKDEWKLSILV